MKKLGTENYKFSYV